jgi:nicotinamide-nucleotide amidase
VTAGAGGARVLRLLASGDRTLAVAESLTGGLLAAALTDVPGASRVFRGSVTAYATALKHEVLGVDAGLLAARGAVDADVARQMAAGVRRVLGADWGLATTGVAGPGPQDGREPGTVFVAVAGPGGTPPRARRLWLEGDRAAVRAATVEAAFRILCDELNDGAGAEDTEQNGGSGCLQP